MQLPLPADIIQVSLRHDHEVVQTFDFQHLEKTLHMRPYVGEILTRDADPALSREGTKNAFLRMLVSIAEFEPENGTGDAFRKPATPLFDRQNLMID